jgi:methyl coenzyme M reductase beta subunit
MPDLYDSNGNLIKEDVPVHKIQEVMQEHEDQKTAELMKTVGRMQKNSEKDNR